jgi:hypothetical protein
MEYRYLILCDGNLPALTHWYEFENHYNAELNMVVFDFYKMMFTKNGIEWHQIQRDHL